MEINILRLKQKIVNSRFSMKNNSRFIYALYVRSLVCCTPDRMYARRTGVDGQSVANEALKMYRGWRGRWVVLEILKGEWARLSLKFPFLDCHPHSRSAVCLPDAWKSAPSGRDSEKSLYYSCFDITSCIQCIYTYTSTLNLLELLKLFLKSIHLKNTCNIFDKA